MPKSLRSETEPLTGEILPLAHVATTTLAEMSPEQFLALHGVKPPKPKAYRLLRGPRSGLRPLLRMARQARLSRD